MFGSEGESGDDIINGENIPHPDLSDNVIAVLATRNGCPILETL
jgi:hypothetical protein